MKRADAISFVVSAINEKGEAAKADGDNTLLEKDVLAVELVINTTNLYDSHGDVHIDGLWKKTLKEQRNLYLLQEHKMAFANIISDDVKATAKTMDWSKLGYPYEGQTQALVFNTSIEKKRNPFMFEQYARGYVKNHSVGMRYVQLELAINSESEWDKEEKAVWDKYYPSIANKEDVDERGYFWAVTEAKLVEGSAVPLGSNFATPTISVKSQEPPTGTQPDIGSRSKNTIEDKEIVNLFKTYLKN